MIENNVNLELMAYVEQNILPKYNNFNIPHGVAYVQRVIKNSLLLAQLVGANVNMAYTVAAYHDIGLSGHKAIHHLTGGKILFADAQLKRWFTTEQIRLMRQAVEDHRASASHSPRSIYGKIVAEAVRDLTPQHIFKHTIQVLLERYPQKTKQELWQRFQQHIQEKYAATGFIKLWIPNSPNEKHLKQIRLIIEKPNELKKQFDYYFEEVKKTICKHSV